MHIDRCELANVLDPLGCHFTIWAQRIKFLESSAPNRIITFRWIGFVIVTNVTVSVA